MNEDIELKLKELYKKQQEAIYNSDYFLLTDINKQIFAINEQKAKERRKQKLIEREERLAKHFEKRLTERGL